ncbi:hypothetical protein [uncultured Leifsonia sp.]|uniref:hypothetical protein n=1 Tax=Leifsonia sp. TaxID=1870902 RepID=UPI0028D6BA47|nr:hypothetical protein [uncultured Leifsonia sp.]
MDWSTVVFLVVIVLAVVAYALYARRQRRTIAEQQAGLPGDDALPSLAEALLQAIRDVAPNHGVFVPIAWGEIGINQVQAVRLSRWLVEHGQVDLPKDYKLPRGDGLVPPPSLALTHNSYSRLAPHAASTNIYGTFLGPTQIGDNNSQTIHGDVVVNVGEVSSTLERLATDLRENAQTAPDAFAGSLLHAADLVEQHVRSGDVESSELRRVLEWIGGFATAVGAGVLSAPVIAGLRALGVPGF